MKRECEISKSELWNLVPQELIRKMIGQWSQTAILNISGVKIPGFRPGKIPPKLLEDKVLREYGKFQGVRQNFHDAVEANLQDVQKAIRKVRIKQFSERISELVEEFGETKVFLAVFLDERKGVRALGPTLWGNYNMPNKEDVVQTIDFQANSVDESLEESPIDRDPKESTATPKSKLHKALLKTEKQLKETREKHRKIVSDRDKKIFEQKKRLAELECLARYKEREADEVNNRLLEKKKQIAKLEGALSSLSGQVRKLQQLREDDAMLIRELRDELEILKSKKPESDLLVQSEAQSYEEIDFKISVRGEFVYNSPDGWVVSEQGIFNIPEEVISQYCLLTGDAVELEVGGNSNNFGITVIQKMESRELAGFIVCEDDDYFVKCGTDKVYVGINEVFRMGASVGDPVSVIVPLQKPNVNVKGRISRIHWVSLVRDMTKMPEKPKKIEKIVKKTVSQDTLVGLKVLVLGGDSRKNSYIQVLQQMGAVVEWHTGFNELHAIPNKVGRADIVLVLTGQMSHKAYYVMKAATRAHGKQPLYYSALSVRGATMAVAGFCQKQRELSLIS